MPRSLMGALFLFLILIGNVLGKVKRNFYIGVRTPWTLASEKVWYATHRFAAKAFVIAGLLGVLSVIFGGEHSIRVLDLNCRRAGLRHLFARVLQTLGTPW